MMKQLVLASKSQSRKKLLEEAGVPFIVDASNYEGDLSLRLTPEALAMQISKEKARQVASRHQNAVILAADSLLAFQNDILDKPRTLEEAKAMLTKLSGHTHTHLTAFTIMDADSGREYSEAVQTEVTLRKLSAQEIKNYLTKERVVGKTHAYRIQGLGHLLVKNINGNYSSVMGLPLAQVALALQKFDFELL